MSKPALGLFDACGIEMEYMIVDQDTLDVRPVADEILAEMAGGRQVSEVEIGPITWSNELALHVIELKTTDPAPKLRPLPSIFEKAIEELQVVLDKRKLQLLPTAVHPWMNPSTQTKLWPHDGHEFYEACDAVFDCRSHGWSNIQSVHLNLPFSSDEEFAKLHAAVRIVLPLLPALTASSPVIDGRYSGLLDTRMLLYTDHCQAVPVLTGDLIPEPLFDQSSYRREIYGRIEDQISAYDPDRRMNVEFLNARGAVARFDRGSIELRVMDMQEYPGADVAICAAVTALIRALCEERWSSLEQQKEMSTSGLRRILDQTCRQAEHTVVEDTEFLSHFGITDLKLSTHRIWTKVLGQLRREDTNLAFLFAPLEIILENGTLASRICTALGKTFSHDSLVDVYREVGGCLKQWEPFQP
jgi:glutamate---cysteine ligase / carboxylate-amine ligase